MTLDRFFFLDTQYLSVKKFQIRYEKEKHNTT